MHAPPGRLASRMYSDMPSTSGSEGSLVAPPAKGKDAAALAADVTPGKWVAVKAKDGQGTYWWNQTTGGEGRECRAPRAWGLEPLMGAEVQRGITADRHARQR